jgi:hypothetical protein
MLSLSDSLRVGQLLEHGSRVLAGSDVSPYTITEIHVDRQYSVTPGKGKLLFTGTLSNAPKSLEYLEGIAFPMELSKFKGGTRGTVVLTKGYVSSSEVTDSASMIITIDAEVINNDVYRTYTVSRKPLMMLKGGTIEYKELESHKAEYKEPVANPDDIEINMNVDTGEIETIKKDSVIQTDTLRPK